MEPENQCVESHGVSLRALDVSRRRFRVSLLEYGSARGPARALLAFLRFLAVCGLADASKRRRVFVLAAREGGEGRVLWIERGGGGMAVRSVATFVVFLRVAASPGRAVGDQDLCVAADRLDAVRCDAVRDRGAACLFNE